MPLPPVDLFISMIDVLAKRYGWSYKEMTEQMWWEDLYEMYLLACNLDTMESNDDMKFNFMLHAGSKDAIKKWQDLSIPFPSDDYIESMEKRSKTSKLASRPELQYAVFRDSRKIEKMDDTQRERLKIVAKKLEEHKKELLEKGLQ